MTKNNKQKDFFKTLHEAEVVFVHDADDIDEEPISCIVGVSSGWPKVRILVHPTDEEIEKRNKLTPPTPPNLRDVSERSYLPIIVSVLMAFSWILVFVLASQNDHLLAANDNLRNQLCFHAGGEFAKQATCTSPDVQRP